MLVNYNKNERIFDENTSRLTESHSNISFPPRDRLKKNCPQRSLNSHPNPNRCIDWSDFIGRCLKPETSRILRPRVVSTTGNNPIRPLITLRWNHRRFAVISLRFFYSTNLRTAFLLDTKCIAAFARNPEE